MDRVDGSTGCPDGTYSFVLDLFPLCATIAEESSLLAQEIHLAALGLLFGDGAQRVRLQTLLQLSYDLGYIDDEVHQYLQRHLRSLG